MQWDTTLHTDGTQQDTHAGTNRRRRLQRRIPVILAVTLVTGLLPTFVAAEPNSNSCWGQASAAYAQQAPGTTGEHASEFETPRLGLGNLASSLGFDSMAELGAFVAEAEGLEVAACE